MLSEAQIDRVEGLIREVAATLIVPRFDALSDDEIVQKSGPDDLVTIADREAELALTPRLMDILPGSVVVGEEATADDPSVPERLLGDDPVWLVDPVDGTRNFVHGLATFGVMVALVHEGTTQAGWIFAPMEGVMARAIKGEGAWLDGKPLQGRKGVSFSDAFGDYSSTYVDPPLRDLFSDALKSVRGTRQGHCSAYAYLDTARGELDFVLQYRMSPWDHAAGVLLVEEAGGAARFLDDGEGYTPLPRGSRAMLTVSDKAMWTDYVGTLPKVE